MELKKDKEHAVFLLTTEGWTFSQIATEYGVTRSYVTKVFKEWGYDSKDRSVTIVTNKISVHVGYDMNRTMAQDIFQYLESNKSILEISKITGLDRKSISALKAEIEKETNHFHR